MKKFITFGGPTPRFHDNVNRLCDEANNFNFFDQIQGFTEKDLMNDTEFWDKHSDFILNNPRGYGYWIWKPYLINRELEKMNIGDILIYLDAGCELNIYAKSRFLEYIDMLEKDSNNFGLISFKTPYKEVEFTKQAVFNYFHSKIDNNQYQCMGGIQIIKKTIHSSRLIRLWCKIVEEYSLINDEVLQNEHPRFIENRHDQSIYSMLVYKFGSIKLNDETSYFEENSKNPFPILARRLTH